MLEKLRKMLTDAGIDPAVGSIDYWQNELEGVLLNMYDQGVAAEREACAKLCDLFANSSANVPSRYEFMGESAEECAKLIRARGEPSPAFKNFIDDKWSGIV